MEIEITSEMKQLLDRIIEVGEFKSASEVVSEALRQMKERDETCRDRLEWLRHEINIGIEQSLRGETVPLDVEQIMIEGRRRLAEKSRAG